MSKLESSRPSQSVEDYLKAIWLNARDGPVSNRTVAMSLGVSRSSVTGMLGKAERSWFSELHALSRGATNARW